MLECSCHRESGSHEACCGHFEGRDPDCPFHGDGGNSALIALEDTEAYAELVSLHAADHAARLADHRQAEAARFDQIITRPEGQIDNG